MSNGVSWHPPNFQYVVSTVNSGGLIIKKLLQMAKMMGSLSCPSPSWDQNGVYRVFEENGKLIIKYLDKDNSWHKADYFDSAHNARLKSEKFKILDSPSLFEADLLSAHGHFGTAFIYLDIDDFKSLNTDFSESVVDADLLPKYQKILADCVEGFGFAYAEGGDESTILLPNASVEIAFAFAESLRSSLNAQIFQLNDRKVQLTVSIGIAHVEENGDKSVLHAHANLAMRESKKKGKDRVYIYSNDGFKEANFTIQ